MMIIRREILVSLCTLVFIHSAEAVSKRSAVSCNIEPQKHITNIGLSLNGYNVLEGYPLAMERDPGFKRKIFDSDYSRDIHSDDCTYHLPYGIAASVDESCHLSFTSTVLEGSEDLRTHLNTYASVSGGGWGVEFSASVEYDKETETFRDSLSKKIESTAICQYYTTLMGLHSKPTFSKEFNTSLDKMNGEMIKNSGKISENTIFQLIDEFGTHYVESMVLGARFTHVHTMSSELYDSMKSQGIDIEVTAEYSGIISAGASAKMSDSQRKAVSKFDEEVKTKTSTMGKLPPADGNVNTWASETAERPSPIKYELKPITEVFDPSIFPGIKNHLSESYAAEIRQQIDRSKHAYCVRKKSQKKFKHLYCSESEIPDEVLPPPVTCKKVYSGLWWPGKA